MLYLYYYTLIQTSVIILIVIKRFLDILGVILQSTYDLHKQDFWITYKNSRLSTHKKKFQILVVAPSEVETGSSNNLINPPTHSNLPPL